jgi:hypothetical protein
MTKTFTIEDEFHFVLNYYITPSSFKLIQLLGTPNVKQLRNLGMFLKQAYVPKSS